MDGFRALAHAGPDETRLVSRKGNVYKSFPGLSMAIRTHLHREAVLDGEIVILDSEGRQQFYDLFRRRGRGEPVLYVFDLLCLDGQDLRTFTPGRRLEVITFEVKEGLDAAVEGVFESLAHSAFAHRSYLAVHLEGYQDLQDVPDDRIVPECERFGVGYIIFSDPGDYDTYDVVVSARLKEPDPADVVTL